MYFNLDIAIVVSFLILNLAVGLFYGRGVKTIKDYAIGNRGFTTAALVATVTATYASGSGFFTTLSKTYTDGLYYVLARFGVGIYFILLALWLIPRMGEFLGKISIAEAMGELYGKQVRLITAITGAIGGLGSLAVQFTVFGNVFSYFLNIPNYIAVILASGIATIYSAFGGIRSVTFTDVLQFFAFGCIIPILGFVIWGQFYNEGYTVVAAMQKPIFDINFVLGNFNADTVYMLLLFAYLVIPDLSPTTFQRIAMGQSVGQVKKVFLISGIILIVITLVTAWIPFLINTMNPNVPSKQLLGYIADNYTYPGLKGLILVAVIAFSMSTADSRINSASVLFTNDICKVLMNVKHEMFISRLFAFLLGAGAITLSLVESDLLAIAILANSYYWPVVTPVFLLTLFGFRSTSNSVLIGMVAGLTATILWKFLPPYFSNITQKIIGLLFSMLCHMIFLIGSHYLLKQSGGWVGIKDRSYLDQQKLQKTQRRLEFKKQLREFSFRKLCQKIAPHNEITYTALGLYFIACTITTMYSTQVELLGSHSRLMHIIYPTMLLTGTVMAMYPLWPLSIATSIKRSIIEIWWPIAIFYMLIFFNCFFVLVSKFAMLQVLLFAINLMLAALLLGWRLGIPAIIIGFYSGIQFYQYSFGDADFIVKFGSPEFMLAYALLILSSTVIFFIKPTQDHLEATEAENSNLKMEITHLDHEVDDLYSQVNDYYNQVTHYSEKISDQEKEIERLGATAQKILNNVNHELRLPVGNVMNFSEMLYKGLGKHSPKMLKELSDQVYKNTNRLSTMILNMLDLANLEVKKVNLEKTLVNLSEIVKNRVTTCRNIYLQGKPINFKLMIDPEIMISVDPNYMRQAIDNLVINAINFSEEGTILVKLEKQRNSILFTIADQGIGIPKEDIFDIFTPFKMGSNTESKAEGRGVGLALCKSIIEAHDGKITAESKRTGAVFRFVLPQ